jgi:hypothetical protein
MLLDGIQDGRSRWMMVMSMCSAQRDM